MDNFLRIPNKLLYYKMKLIDKILLSDILSFYHSDLVYYKTNHQISIMTNSGLRTVTTSINSLVDNGYVIKLNEGGKNRELHLTKKSIQLFKN